jgi:ABC-type polysaccharide/polyol phosphate transport system ATPase subunit
MAAVEAEALAVRFLVDRRNNLVTPGAARLRRRCSEVWGLRGIDLSIGRGEGVALVGPSGAGKTTLLRTLAGVHPPDAGRLAVAGRIGPLLSVGAGVLAQLSGRENALLLTVLAGVPRSAARGMLDRIGERSGLGSAFERPVASYSLGMRARLSFASIEPAAPDVLLLDEVHEALDHEYRDVMTARARQILDDGGIVVAAGHDHGVLERFCSRGILMDRGSVLMDAPLPEVLTRYGS